MRYHWTNIALFATWIYSGIFVGQAHAQLDCVNWNTYTFFKNAIAQDVINCLEQGVDIEARDKNGLTPLHYSESAEVVNALLNAGADIEARDKNGLTPLYYAEFTEVVNALLNAGADIEARDKKGGTPLCYAKSAEVVNCITQCWRKHRSTE